MEPKDETDLQPKIKFQKIKAVMWMGIGLEISLLDFALGCSRCEYRSFQTISSVLYDRSYLYFFQCVAINWILFSSDVEWFN